MDNRAEDRIRSLIADSGAESVSVAFELLRSGDQFLIQPDVSYHAASTMKVCVLMELFHQANIGSLSLDDEVPVHNEFPSLIDGAMFRVGAEDDSYQPLYGLVGQKQTLIELARPMITHSSNLATNLLIERLGTGAITGYMDELGANGLNVIRYIEDAQAYRLSRNTTVTAAGLNTVLGLIARGKVASSSAMLDILLNQTHRDFLPSKLPSEARTANKPGWNGGTCHDTGVVYSPNGEAFVLTVLTKGLEKEEGAELIGGIAAAAYEYVNV